MELYELVSDPSNLRAAFGMGKHGQRHTAIATRDAALQGAGAGRQSDCDRVDEPGSALQAAEHRNRGACAQQKLSAETSQLIEQALILGSWHVVLENDKLAWKPPQDSDLKEESTDPDTSLPLRMMLRILAPLVPDSVL